jgi:endonuclease YncB( thermonuclease family)
MLVAAAPALAVNCSDFSSQLAAQNYYNQQVGDPDGLDADHDGFACESLPAPKATVPKGSTPAPPPPPPPPAQCSDGIDNDLDGRTDYPADAGCSSVSDASETPDPPLAAQCFDQIDNDLDGRTDYPAEAGCSSVSDASETPDPTVPPVSFVARVVRVIDGDTIKVRTSIGRRLTVRLVGIDAPATTECGGRSASAYMKRQTMTPSGRGSLVRLTPDPTQKRFDGSGRTQVYAKLIGPDTDLGRRMIRAGWATTLVTTVPFPAPRRLQRGAGGREARGVGRLGRMRWQLPPIGVTGRQARREGRSAIALDRARLRRLRLQCQVFIVCAVIRTAEVERHRRQHHRAPEPALKQLDTCSE